MSEQRLNGADVLARLEKVRREAVPEAVRGETDGQTCPSYRFPYGALNPLLIKMVTPDMPATGNNGLVTNLNTSESQPSPFAGDRERRRKKGETTGSR